MASSFTDLGIELMTTGENSGTWGDKTNANLQVIQQGFAGYQDISIAGVAQTTTLTISNSVLSNGRNAVIKFTGTITGNQVVTIPDSIEKTYIIENGTTGAFTVEFKTVSGTGVTFGATDKSTKIVFSDGTNIVDTGFVSLTGVQTLTNKTLTSPTITSPTITSPTITSPTITDPIINEINDTNGNEEIIFATTASAVNEFTVTNAATGNAPALSATGNDTNIDLNLTPKGLGRVTFNGGGKIQQTAEKVTIAAVAATGTVQYDVLTQSVLYYTSNASGNWVLNIRGDSSNTLNSIMDIGESITIAHLVTMTTAYYSQFITIDSASITPEWQGGTAPSSGNANSVDTYSYTIIKTANATFKVLASQTQFA
jgi:hypothetical protein